MDWQFVIELNLYLPRSIILSINFILGPTGFDDECMTFPGWIVSAIRTAIRADISEVKAKYVTALTVIRPLTFGLILAETVMRHDKRSGNVRNFKMRRKSSPGYEINKIASSGKCTDRIVVPEERNECNIFRLARVVTHVKCQIKIGHYVFASYIVRRNKSCVAIVCSKVCFG